MSVEENKTLVRRAQGVLWNHTGDLDAAAELFAPDHVEDTKQEAANVRRGFPDLESTMPLHQERHGGPQDGSSWLSEGVRGEFTYP